MSNSRANYKDLCLALLRAQSEDEVTSLLSRYGLLDIKHWKVLGDMPNNRAIVNNQSQDPTGALVEKMINSIDAMLTKECFLRGVNPDSSDAPCDMTKAAERFFRVRGGDLANLSRKERTMLAENIQLVATGSKSDPSYLVIDRGEGQTPLRFEETFLSLRKSNKARIPFVQGKFNCGGTGVLPFCGKQAYQLIISRRCPELPSGPSLGGPKDPTHSLWGFTVVRKLLPSQRVFDTATYVYLAPDGQIPAFEADQILALPDVSRDTVGEETETEGNEADGAPSPGGNTPRPYAKPLECGTVIKVYNYRWQARSCATLDARFALERYLYRLSLPFRVVETRPGFEKAHYLATTVAGTAVTIADDRQRGYLESDFPLSGEICPDDIGIIPLCIGLYREQSKTEVEEKAQAKKKRTAKDPRRLAKGLSFTINGQVHCFAGPEFFLTRGLNYEWLKDTLVVAVDCTGIHEDIRDQLIMPSRDRLRKLPEFDTLLEAVVSFLKDCDILRAINDERKLRRVQAALHDEATQDVFQSLVNKDPVFASLFGSGLKLRNPWSKGPEPQPYKGKLPPTFFHFEGGKHETRKSFAIDRTCAVELETDAVNDYFHLPDPNARGALDIQPRCYERWNLLNGHLRVVFRAPSNARVGDTLKVTITVTDPCLSLRGDPPWVNTVHLTFAAGGKEVKSGGEKKKQGGSASLALPDISLVYRDRWVDHGFNERSALRITHEDGNYRFWVNMDNVYLQNELMRRKDPEKEAAKFAYKWGLALIALGMLQELKKQQNEQKETSAEKNSSEEERQESIEEQVGRFSVGVAAVIIPTVMHLMDAMKEERALEEAPG